MNKKFLSVFAFAVVVSAIASLVLFRLITARFALGAKPAATELTVAARNLELGSLVREGDLATIAWSGALPPNTLLKKENILGRGVISEIYQGEPILESRLAPTGAGAGLAALIPPGKRAVAIRVNDIVGVAGFVFPGSRIDVLISGLPPGGDQASLGTQTRTILQDLEVLSAGQNIQKSGDGKPVAVAVVNLLATPDQAEVLSLAGNDARIQLVLRNPLDKTQAETAGTALANLFAGRPAAAKPLSSVGLNRPRRVAAPAPVLRTLAAPVPAPAPSAPAPPPPPIVVEILVGTRKSEVRFENPDAPKLSASPAAARPGATW